jgi:hypothetical protein
MTTVGLVFKNTEVDVLNLHPQFLINPKTY